MCLGNFCQRGRQQGPVMEPPPHHRGINGEQHAVSAGCRKISENIDLASCPCSM